MIQKSSKYSAFTHKIFPETLILSTALKLILSFCPPLTRRSAVAETPGDAPYYFEMSFCTKVTKVAKTKFVIRSLYIFLKIFIFSTS